MPGDLTTLAAHLEERRGALAQDWFHILAVAGFASWSPDEIRQRLNELVQGSIAVLCGESFDDDRARALGSGFAELRYASPGTLAQTLSLLARDLYPADEPTQLLVAPRLARLLAQFAEGFHAGILQQSLEEQEQIRHALFVSRQTAEAAEEARAIAEAAARARSELLGRVAHDLRTPLTGLRGQADLIAMRLGSDRPLPVEWLDLRVRQIRRGAERMRHMIDELLDAARLEIGEQLELNVEPVDLVELSRRVVDDLDTAQGRVQIEAGPGTVMVSADAARLERVVENLLSNALKYSAPHSPVVVAVAAEQDGGTIAVRDLGVGIPPDELEQVTQPFYRASTARGVPGIGLGLSGVKAIIEQHGGKFSISSAVDRGTTVQVELPVQPAA